jgi:hypothetical protein
VLAVVALCAGGALVVAAPGAEAVVAAVVLRVEAVLLATGAVLGAFDDAAAAAGALADCSRIGASDGASLIIVVAYTIGVLASAGSALLLIGAFPPPDGMEAPGAPMLAEAPLCAPPGRAAPADCR